MRTVKLIITSFVWLLAAASILVLAVLTFGSGGIITLLLFAMVLRMAATIRRRRAASVIAYLEQAVRLNLPLPKMIAAASASETGQLSMRLGQLSRQLESGVSVGAAVRAAVPEVAAAPIALLEAAERIGRLPHALSRLAKRAVRRSEADSTDTAFSRVYPILMSIIICGAVSLICVFVIPKYETIFHDFGTKLPAVTQFMLDIARSIGPLALVATIVAVPLWAAIGLWQAIHPDSAWRFLRGTRDRILWAMPFTHGWARDRGLAEALDLMAEAIRAGQPIDRAATEAASLQVNAVLRKRLARWAERLQAGDSLPDSARHADLPDLMVQLLAPVRGGEQATDVLSFLARYYDARFSRARLLLEAAALPAMVFFFAFIVAGISLALFLPMITLIQNISSPSSNWRP